MLNCKFLNEFKPHAQGQRRPVDANLAAKKKGI